MVYINTILNSIIGKLYKNGKLCRGFMAHERGVVKG